MKIFKIIVVFLLVAFVGMQFVPTERNQSDVVLKTDFMAVNKVPNTIKNILQVSCYDCHSNNTVYPWYSVIQPGAWFMESHIKDGKKELNFSEWSAYSNRRKKGKLKSIINQIKDNKMPLSSYTFIHQDAKITKKEKQALTNWLITLRDNL